MRPCVRIAPRWWCTCSRFPHARPVRFWRTRADWAPLKVARPSLLTEDIITRIVAAVSIGAKPEQAARALGIGRRTWYDWVKRARDATSTGAPKPGDHLYVTLLDEIDRARGSAYVELMMHFRTLAQRDWRAAMKLLEMTDNDWARAAGQETAAATEPPTIHIVIEARKPTRFNSATGKHEEVDEEVELPPPDRSPSYQATPSTLDTAARILDAPETK